MMSTLMYALELIGVAAFAVSGAMAAMEKRADVFGVIFLGIVTALGGGVIRDVLLGYLPPRMFRSYTYVLAAVLVSLLVFIDAYLRRESYSKNREKLDAVNNVFDAAGLAVFTVSGMNTALGTAHADNAFLVVLLGMTTGIGGGMLRDVMINTMPKVLRKRVYAIASLAGGIVYYALWSLGVNEIASAAAGMLIVFAMRMLATVFRWNLPSADIN